MIRKWQVCLINCMYMIGETSNFNQPLDDWNVASVNKMVFVFYGYWASVFNQPLDD